MIEPSLALQKAIFDRLKDDEDVIELVPAANIFDRHGLPTASHCIILGDDQTIRDALSLDDNSFRVAATLHVWAKGTNVVLAKRIAGAITVALRGPFWTFDGYRAAWVSLSQTQFVRDPGGEWAHAVLTFEAMLVEEAA